MIPLDKIDAENVFYWNWICSKCKVDESSTSQDKSNKQRNMENIIDREAGLNSSNENHTTNENDDDLNMTKKIEGENQLDNLLPSLTEYCDYIYQYVVFEIESPSFVTTICERLPDRSD
jgi:hypothetical protein